MTVDLPKGGMLAYNPDPFGAPGEWLRCGLHAHSTGSDGKLSPRELAAGYRRAGYDVLCVTDHNKMTPVAGLGDEGLLVLPGQEIHPLSPPSDHGTFHLVAINLREEIPGRELLPNMAIAEARAQGAEVILAHPAWSSHHLEEILGLEGFIGIEVFNELAHRLAKGSSEDLWDRIISLRGLIWGLATDDAHGADLIGKGWVWLKAAARTPEAVLAALRHGQFYASQGPRLACFGLEIVEHEDRTAGRRRAWKASATTAEPVRAISFVTSGDWGKRFSAEPGEALDRAELVLSQWVRWVRVAIEDREGRRAWSNPLLVPPATKA